MSNRLAAETSPYLLQHKDNPVDWYPWGPEALDRARSEDKPIFLSIGYAACHWCHVMERESFEDPATARLLNDDFVAIKVDREERPDLDAIYMDAVQAMTGQGGWPMSVFLTPDGAPFYGGTYFPPEDRYGMPSFKRLLTAIAQTWRERRSEAELQGKRLVEHLDPMGKLAPSDDPISDRVLELAEATLRESFDPEWGGFGNAPKFPQPMTIDLLHRLALRGSKDAGAMAARTLDAMAAGGMFDQLGGGFARYSVDRFWLVPHFEKMLYDNAQLLRTYARSWLLTEAPRHRRIAEMTAEWMMRELRDPGGGFWSSLDADSEGEEGRFYLWTLDEVEAAAGTDTKLAVERWGFSEGGNFEGRNIPVHAAPRDDGDVERVRRALLEARERRVRPATDTKVLASWNGFAVAALAEAGTILSRPDLVAAGREAAEFVLSQMRVDGRLMRAYRDGMVKHLGFAEDYAAMIEGVLALYEATHEASWLGHARGLADATLELFHDGERGGFFTTGTDAEELITRSKDLIDNAVPSANSILAIALQKLSLLSGEPRYEEAALGILRLVRGALDRSPLAFGTALAAVDLYLGDPTEVVLLRGEGIDDLLATVRKRWLPNSVLVVGDEGDDGYLLEERRRIEGRATAFVCRRGSCKTPVTEPVALAELL